MRDMLGIKALARVVCVRCMWAAGIPAMEPAVLPARVSDDNISGAISKRNANTAAKSGVKLNRPFLQQVVFIHG